MRMFSVANKNNQNMDFEKENKRRRRRTRRRETNREVEKSHTEILQLQRIGIRESRV